MKLAEAHRDQTRELARVRFKVNFGTTLCDNCDGLHAGPGVAATCFQIKECHFRNVREEPTGEQRTVIQNLLGESE